MQIFNRTKTILVVTIFHEVAQNPQEFHEFSMIIEIPEYSRFYRFVATPLTVLQINKFKQPKTNSKQSPKTQFYQ